MNYTKHRLTRWQQFARMDVVLLLCIIILLVVRGSLYLGYASGNAGVVLLNKAQALPAVSTRVTSWTENLLTRAVTFTPDNRAHWRSLGFILAFQGKDDKARDAWQNAGEMGEEFMWRGDEARNYRRYDEALVWYEHGQAIEPEKGEWSYYQGLIYESKELWETALAAYEQGLPLPLKAVGQSDIFYRIGRLHLRKIESSSLEEALASFDKAIAQDSFSSEAQKVQTHYDRGETLLRLGRLEEALLDFEWVVVQEPSHYPALVGLGTLLWETRRDLETAEEKLLLASSLEPNNKWAYRVLARIYQQAGAEVEATKMYRQVLTLDPQDQQALERIDNLTLSGED